MKTKGFIFGLFLFITSIVFAFIPILNKRTNAAQQGNILFYVIAAISFFASLLLIIVALRKYSSGIKFLFLLIITGVLIAYFNIANSTPQPRKSATLKIPTVTPTLYVNTDPAKIVCQGQPLENAAEYSPSDEIHPVWIIADSNSLDLPALYYPQDWRAKDVSELQLVACVTLKWEVIETCKYERSLYAQRQQQYANIIIYEAKTGKIVGSKYLTGSKPNECPFQMSFNSGESKRVISGSIISAYTIATNITQWVKP
jgi:energy-coupling factor transporter transmembrane protein EcfT